MNDPAKPNLKDGVPLSSIPEGGRRRFPTVALALAVLLLVPVSAFAWARTGDSADSSSLDSPVDTETIRLPVVEGKDIRFGRISTSQGLSQVRVSDMVQDDQGFIWFGTWNGLNRYDGYNFKVFKHDPERPESLGGVYIYSLFKDRAGTIWVGTDQSLDGFDPLTEKFSHYHFDVPDSSGLPTTVNQISQDSSGMLWLSTRKGLFRLDPVTGKSNHFYHDPGDPSSLGDSAIVSTGEDRAGRFWVGTSRTLDEFDRNTGKVKRHVLIGESGIGVWFHEDRLGVFWIIYGPDGTIATFDPKTNKLTRYGFDSRGPESNLKNPAYALLEDHEGTMWFGTAVGGLLKFDREHRRFISYHHLPGDPDSLIDNRVIALFEDREKNIWVGMHDVEPHFFATRPQPFTKLTNPSGSRNRISPGLVGALYDDRQGGLWVGVNRSLVRIDRKTGLSSSFQPASGSEVLSIIEDGPDVLWIAGTNPLMRYNQKTGELRRYIHDRADPSTLCSGVVQRLLIDHQGILWAATWDGLCRFDALTQRFTTYKPDPKTRGLNYYAIAEDPQGNLWLGGNLGLHRFDTNANQFTVYSHKSDDPHSLSDNRVVAIYFDRAGTMWVGTQNGLDKFDPRTNTFVVYNERDGMGGNVVSCILEDQHGLLWMSTNKGVSSFDPRTQKVSNYTVADGLPGPDLTGWGAGFKSASGEMFFGGFSGVTAFSPDQVAADAVVANAFVPPIVLTDFRLFGRPVTLGPGSPLNKAVNYTNTITLSHAQNIFSIGFSALSFFNPATNRYRYMLDGLDQKWNEVGSDQRLASYTTLPSGTYMFHVQGASGRGPWSEPGAQLRIKILPPWWSTWWFRVLAAAVCLALLWGLYRVRVQQLRGQEKKLRDVIETMPTFAWTALPDGCVDFVNLHWQEYTGLSAEKTAGSGWEAAVRPEDLKRHAEKWRASVASGAPFENEVRYRRAADEQYRWFLARAVPVRDQRGKILKWYGTSTDIEDRKRAGEALQQSQFYINEGERVAHMGSWAFNAGGFEYWSSELFRIHGLDPSGKPPTVERYLALVHPEDRAFMRQGIAKMLEDHLAFDFTKRIVRPDGAIRHIRFVGVPVTQGGTFQGFLGTGMDVTEQERLTEELRLSERYLSETQSLAHTGSWAIDGRSRETVYWSSEMFRLFAFDPQEGLPTFDRWLQRIHPEDRYKVNLAGEKMFSTKETYDIEYRIVEPDGTVKHIHGIGHPVLSATGELVQVVGTMVDVTERKRAEEARDRLRRLEADLAHINRVSTLGEMAASLAHEIKQPIAAAITSANSCIEWLAHEPPNLDRARAAAARIDTYGNRAAEIIDRIRSFYKKSPPQRELVDVNGIIHELLTLLESEATRFSVAMRTELAAELPKIMADRVQLQQVFMNLMLNGIEAMEDSGGGLTVKSELQDGQLQFSVSDTGVGLPLEKMDQIFSAFYTNKPQGSGMGLTISRSIVESHGGRLWATTNGRRGATFHFTLPTHVMESALVI